MAGIYAAITPQTHLYRCGWVEAGEVKYSLQTSLVRADKAMRARLSEGLPAWLEQVPFTDDDVPF